MSEPIFRAFNNKTKEWIDNFLITPNGRVVIQVQQSGWQNFKDVVTDATLCRSTGLRDRKRTKEFPDGEMIFEFDIVKGHYGARNSIECGEVFYKKEYLQYYVKDAFNNEFCLHGFDQSPYRKIDIEIIGSSLENQELLEEKK